MHIYRQSEFILNVKKPRFSTVDMIVALVIVNIVFSGYLSSQLLFNSQINHDNQKSILQLLNQQGNLSSVQRQKLLDELEKVSSEGGFAVKSQQTQNYHLLLAMNHTLGQFVNHTIGNYSRSQTNTETSSQTGTR